MTTATERFKALFADMVERVCVLEAELEQARARIAELEEEAAAREETCPGAGVG